MTLTLHWPQITWLIFGLICIIGGAVLHGKPKDGNHSFFVNATSVALSAWLLWCGGFFG